MTLAADAEGEARPPQRVRAPDQLFVSLGYVECPSGVLETGCEKVALLAHEGTGEPTHAARPLQSGKWASKIGDWEDIVHNTVHGLEDDIYVARSVFSVVAGFEVVVSYRRR